MDVLSACKNPELLMLRDAVLRVAGLDVLGVFSVDEAEERLKMGDVKVLLIGQCFQSAERDRLIRACRHHSPSTRILLLVVGAMPIRRADADAVEDSLCGPEELTATVRRLLGHNRRARCSS